MAGFKGTTIDSEDRYAVDVLASILGSSFSGRLFKSVRENEGNAYNLGGFSIPGIDTGYIYFYVLTSPEGMEPSKEILLNELVKIASEEVSEKELNDTKSFLKGTFREGLETNSALSFVSGLDELYGMGFDNYKEYSKRIDNVTAQDILFLAKKYLNKDAMILLTVEPKGVEASEIK